MSIRSKIISFFCFLVISSGLMAGQFVEIKTNLGNILVELDEDKAPRTSKNFLRYVDEKFYNGTIFHRVIPGFMIQGGGYTADFKEKPVYGPIPNEANNGLKNTRGTIAMARTADPNSATAQFFINLADNTSLDHTAATSQGWGYAVFGHVLTGMDVVDKIAEQKTGRKNGHSDVPVKTIEIISIERVATKPLS